MCRTELIKDIAFVTVGGCGNNIGYCFEKLGYPVLHINSSQQDLLSIKGAKNIRHLKNFEGCAGDRKRAELALSENMDIVDEIISMPQKIIYVVFSASGGTGSGVAPALAEMLTEETDKKICCIVVLPSDNEDYGFHINAYKCCQELFNIGGLGSVMFLNNNANTKPLINSTCASMLHAFIGNNSISTKSNLDEQEKRVLIETPGNFILSVLGSEKATENKVVETLTTTNIFAPLQDDGKCEYLGIIHSGKPINKETIIKTVGIPQRTFEGYGSATHTITVVSGASYPFNHLNKLKDIAKEKHEARMQSMKKSQNVLEDIEFTDEDVKQIVEIPKKRVSRRELLKQLQTS